MKRGTPDHPKVWLACKAIGIRRPALLGHLVLLWEFAAQYTPQGDIGRYPDERIEAAMDWLGRRGKLIAGLLQAGWIEEHPTYRLVIHDWPDHCEDAVHRKLARGKLFFVDGKAPRLTRLTDSVRKECALFYDNVRPGCAQGAPKVRPKCALPLPLPLPEASERDSSVTEEGEAPDTSWPALPDENQKLQAIAGMLQGLGQLSDLKTCRQILGKLGPASPEDFRAALMRANKRVRGPGLLPLIAQDAAKNRKREAEKARDMLATGKLGEIDRQKLYEIFPELRDSGAA